MCLLPVNFCLAYSTIWQPYFGYPLAFSPSPWPINPVQTLNFMNAPTHRDGLLSGDPPEHLDLHINSYRSFDTSI